MKAYFKLCYGEDNMNVIDQINNKATQVTTSAKVGVQSLILVLCKIISGMVLGLTFSLIGEQVFQYGPILFSFVFLTVTGAFYRISKPWGSVGLLIFDLLCVLAALLIRMYVVVAPG